jgi:dipeptidase D
MRANANIVLCDAVRRLRYFGVHTYLLGLGRCGDAANAIPSRASAELAVPTVQKEPLDKIAAMIENIFRDKYRSTDPELSVKIRAIEGAAAISENAAMKTKDKRNNAPPDEYPTVHGQTPYSDETVFALTQIAASVLDGPIAYNAAMPQLVETSSNLGIIKDEGAHIAMTYMVRSFVDAVREQVVDDMLRTAARCGAVSESGNRSPGWVYKAENRLRDIFLSKYKELFGAEAVASAVHAGLECGHFADKFREFENMDFISCGPTITEVHSINETLHTDTVPKFGKLLVEVLGSL